MLITISYVDSYFVKNEFFLIHGQLSFEFQFIRFYTTTTTKPSPTKWGRLHGSNYAIVL
jgi:hypothetical protein